MSKEYRCICGKIFDNSQKFNGHKSNCKEHIENKYGDKSTEYFQQYDNIRKQNGLLSKASKQFKKEEKLNLWISEQHTCEKCGKIMTEKYGSGRFCSRSCANSHKHSDETKKKISQSNKNKYEYVEVDGNLITVYQKSKLDQEIKLKEQKYLDKCTKRQNKIQELDVINSPYNDFDTVYFNSGSYKDCYYFIRHDSKGSIVERVIVPVYRYNVEYNIKRRLTYDEVIHHKDGNHYNNRMDNLQMMSRSEHALYHHSQKIASND